MLCWWKRIAGVVRVQLAQPPDRRSPTERAHPTVISIADRSWASQRPSLARHFTLHFTFLQGVPLRWVTQNGDAREELLVRGARLCLRSAHTVAAQHHRPEPGGAGGAAGYLSARGGRVGGRPELPQDRAPQTAHYPGDASLSLCRRARGGGDPRAVEGGAPEGAAG